MNDFSVFDLIFAIAMLIAVISGFIRGFVRQLFGLLGIFVGTYCAYKLSIAFTKWWKGYFDVDEKVMQLISFIIIAAIIYVLVLWLAILIGKLLKMAMLSWVNRLFGMLFGAMKIVLIFSAVAYSICYLKQTGVEIKDIDKSVTYDYLISIANSAWTLKDKS
jgi:membrane protein required for colicin V production